jgi:hypothetical protein
LRGACVCKFLFPEKCFSFFHRASAQKVWRDDMLLFGRLIRLNIQNGTESKRVLGPRSSAPARQKSHSFCFRFLLFFFMSSRFAVR